MGEPRETSGGKWLALTAALLGWMFDGLEMGLFPLVGRPALRDLLGGTGAADEKVVGFWFSITMASFLVGAATGGVLFGWLGDRLGRLRAMMLSVLTYALVSGLCGLATAPWHIAALRFVAALGMGGEWSLGVALVMEIWPDRSRTFLAGLIGMAANLGYFLVALMGLALDTTLGSLRDLFLTLGLPETTVRTLVAHSGWRVLMLLCAGPALLTFFIRLYVPESRRWLQEREAGGTSHWATHDLLALLAGSLGGLGLIALWSADLPLALQVGGSLVGLLIALAGFLYPVLRYLQRSGESASLATAGVVQRMLLGACLSGIPLLGTWAAIQWASLWADQLAGQSLPTAKSWTGMATSAGAVAGTLFAALLGDWAGRRWAYALLCLGSFGAMGLFFWGNSTFGSMFLASAFLAGGLSASFYGWLPLYLPELFPTRVRATGQGFSFNFGRIIAAAGVMQMPNLLEQFDHNYPRACSVVCVIYLVGAGLIWLAPETRGKALPE